MPRVANHFSPAWTALIMSDSMYAKKEDLLSMCPIKTFPDINISTLDIIEFAAKITTKMHPHVQISPKTSKSSFLFPYTKLATTHDSTLTLPTSRLRDLTPFSLQGIK